MTARKSPGFTIKKGVLDDFGRNYGDVLGIIDGIQDGVTIPGSKNDQ